MIGQQLIDLIGQATEADLADLRAQIAEAQKRLDALRAVERVMQARLGKGPAGSQDAPPDSLTSERRRQVALYLHASGPAMQKTLCIKLGIPEGSITKVLACAWFERTTADKWSPIALTRAGREAIQSIVTSSPIPAATG